MRPSKNALVRTCAVLVIAALIAAVVLYTRQQRGHRDASTQRDEGATMTAPRVAQIYKKAVRP